MELKQEDELLLQKWKEKNAVTMSSLLIIGLIPLSSYKLFKQGLKQNLSV